MGKNKSTQGKTRISGSTARRAGSRYELKIIKELRNLYNTESFVSSRSESRRLDSLGVDIVDKENLLPMYVQCKNTQATPSSELITQAKVHDKPLAIFWNKRVRKESRCESAGEFVIVKKEFFYNLLIKNEGIKDSRSSSN